MAADPADRLGQRRRTAGWEAPSTFKAASEQADVRAMSRDFPLDDPVRGHVEETRAAIAANRRRRWADDDVRGQGYLPVGPSGSLPPSAA